MYRIIYRKDNQKVVDTVKITPTLREVGYNDSVYNTTDVENIPNFEKTESLFYRNGRLIGELDEEKTQAIKNAAIQLQIDEKKALLLRYREDVEQVDLFGMKRDDYTQKKEACRTLVADLRILEASIKKENNA